MKAQQVLPEVPEPPQTTIYRAFDKISVGDFESYIIEHEREVHLLGRINSQRFSAFIQMGTIRAYYSASRQLLLLSGKKADILDFCNHTAHLPDLKISTIEVDMKGLLKKLGEVKLAWFRFQKGLVRASALMGAHLEKTSEFKTAKTEGDISTLSFHFEDNGDYHPVMITDDGAVVLQGAYDEITSEINIALNIKRLLLDGIYEEHEIKAFRRRVQL